MPTTELFTNGRVLDAILAGMAIETAVLAGRLAVGGTWWGWISACLALAGLLHLRDLRRRLRLN